MRNMGVTAFLEVANSRAYDVESLNKQGRCEIWFDQKHKVVVESDEQALFLKADITLLSPDAKKRSQQLKASLKISAALLKSTLASPFIDDESLSHSGGEKGLNENGSLDAEKVGTNDFLGGVAQKLPTDTLMADRGLAVSSASTSVSASTPPTLQLIRYINHRLQKFEMEKELEEFLAALEVYKNSLNQFNQNS